MTSHQRQIAHLKPAWKPGQSGNAGGRPKNSLYVSEALRMLSDASEGELQVVADDKSAKAALRIAAKQYLTALRADGADLRSAGDSTDRIADRLEGKPTQVQKIETDSEPVKNFNLINVPPGVTGAPPQLPPSGDAKLLPGGDDE